LVVIPETPLAAAPSIPPFEVKLRAAGELAVGFKTGEARVEEVIAKVRAAGVAIADLKIEDPDLEDVFVSLTYAAPDEAVEEA
ncbi:MAG: ABC transporter ATP-binding protein, partial [Caulobacteraceae bacterium]